MSGPWEDYRVGQDIPDPRTGQPVTVSNVSRQQPQFGDVQTGPDTFVRPPWEDVVANDPLTQGGAMDQALQLRPGESRRYRNENGDLTVVRPVEKPNRALWAGWGDFGQSGRQGGLEGVAATLGSLGDYTGFLRDMWDTGGKVTGDFDYEANPYRGAAEAIPGSRDVLSRLQENTGIAPYEPQSIAGDYARTGGQFSIGLLGGPEAVVPTVASAAASETAGQVARALGASPEAEMGARAAAGFAGGFVQPGRPLGMFNRAARGMSEAEIAQTEALMQQAQAQGVPITVAEAAQQVTNGRTGLGRVQRLAEGTAEGQRAMSGMMAERPQAVRDAFFRALMTQKRAPAARTVPEYFDRPSYIDALAQSVERVYATLPARPDVLVASYHGMPKRYLMEGDPYHCQCQKTSRLLRERLGWQKGDIDTTFQSVFGREEWLKPYTVEHVAELAKAGKKNIAVISPAFSADCIETLEEINGEIREAFVHAGGESFTYIPCLNDDEPHVRALMEVVEENLAGWID